MTGDLDTRRGVVTAEPDGGRRLEFRRSWPDPIEDVWSALTEPERLARWIGSYQGERGSGGSGTFAMTFEEGEPVGQPVRIAECDPPHRLVLQWTVGEQGWRVELDLSREDERTVLVFRQTLAAAAAEIGDIATGWHWYLDKLDAEVGGRPQPPDWDTFLAEVGPGYAPNRS